MKAYFEEIVKSDKPTLVAFLHAAGQDAVDVKYLLEELKTKYGDKVNLQRVDSSYNHHIADKYSLNAYPMYVLFKQGQELMRESGSKTVTELSDMIDRAL